MKKNPLEYRQGLYADIPDFCAVSGFSAPPDSSFYLCLGSGILESLARLKLQPGSADNHWISLINSCKEISVANDSKMRSFLKFLGVIKDASIENATNWLKYYMENNYQEAVDALEHGIKQLITSLCPGRAGHLDVMSILNALEERLRISVFLINHEGRSEYYNGREGNILVCLCRTADGFYYILYHKDQLFVDENFAPPEGGINRFPFVFIPPVSQEAPRQAEHAEQAEAPEVPEEEIPNLSTKQKLIMILAGKILNDRVSNTQLLRYLDQVITENPQLENGYAKQLRDNLTQD